MDISPPESSTVNPKSPSPSSSSDFEFTVSLSPTSRKPSQLCPADELFYKGQLLPLHLSPRLSMVRTLLASSSSSSSSEATTAASRDSTGSSAESTASFSSDLLLLPDCESARPSSATEDLFSYDDEFKKPKKFKYLPSLPKLSSVFTRKDNKNAATPTRRITTTAKEVIRKYVKKVKPLYEKLASKQNLQAKANNASIFSMMPSTATKPNLRSVGFAMRRDVMGVEGFGCGGGSYSHSFSGNLRYPRRRSCVSSCPSSMRSSPSHSGILRGSGGSSSIRVGGMHLDSSSMEELQNAIQGAIAHCKKSMREGDEQQRQTTLNGEDG